MSLCYPFTFATSSELWGGDRGYGMYPVKLYNSSRVLIYQEVTGGDNRGKLPSGGMYASAKEAGSMNETIANPNTFYGYSSVVIDQSGQSGDLYNYYFASYSRGTDGERNNQKWHSPYLDSYIPLRHKSIYDPCPYGYRVPSNGTYNEFNTNPGWTAWSYVGGVIFNNTWLVTTGDKAVNFIYSGFYTFRRSATTSDEFAAFSFGFYPDKSVFKNYSLTKAAGYSLRCIEDCDLLPDQTHSSAGY